MQEREVRLSVETSAILSSLGWEFMPSGPDEFEWMKFAPSGKRIGVQGDAVWEFDLRSCHVGT